MERNVGYYLGLPIITDEEDAVLRLRLESTPNGEYAYLYIADVVLMSNPDIGRIIEHDVGQFSGYEASPELDEDEKGEYIQGIRDGYDFVIATFTWTRFLRSNASDIEAFIVNEPFLREVPKIQTTELDRIREVRSGNIAKHLIDWCSYGSLIESSKDMAQVIAGEYSFEATNFEALVQSYLAVAASKIAAYLNIPTDHPLIVARTEGFHHGLDNAVNMYVLAREARLLSELDFPTPKDML